MYLLKAYRQLRRDGFDCRLLLVGAGPQEREVRRYIATRRLQGVELLGRVSEQDKARAFATADVFVSPATGQESFGIVLLEAMAAGRAHRVQRHPRLQGRRPPGRAGAARAAQGPRGAGRRPSARCCATRRCGRGWARRGVERAVQFSWENITAKVDDYYGFVIRRLASQGALPPGFHAAVPQAVRAAPPAGTPIESAPATEVGVSGTLG